MNSCPAGSPNSSSAAPNANREGYFISSWENSKRSAMPRTTGSDSSDKLGTVNCRPTVESIFEGGETKANTLLSCVPALCWTTTGSSRSSSPSRCAGNVVGLNSTVPTIPEAWPNRSTILAYTFLCTSVDREKNANTKDRPDVEISFTRACRDAECFGWNVIDRKSELDPPSDSDDSSSIFSRMAKRNRWISFPVTGLSIADSARPTTKSKNCSRQCSTPETLPARNRATWSLSSLTSCIITSCVPPQTPTGGVLHKNCRIAIVGCLRFKHTRNFVVTCH